jgi:uncharacterized membrane protein YbhN (UPF0104 family)
MPFNLRDFYKKHTTAVRWAGAAAGLTWVFYYFYQNKNDLVILKTLDPRLLGAMTLFFILGHFIYAYRFGLILRKNSQQPVPYGACVRSTILNRFFCLFAPQSGNVYQGIYLRQRYQVSYTHFLSGIVAINWFDTCLNLLLALGLVMFLRPGMKFAHIPAIYFLIGLIAALIVIPLLIEFILGRISFRNRFLRWLHGRFAELFRVVLQNMKDPAYDLLLTISGIISFLNTIIVFYLCFRAMGIAIDWPAVAFFHVVLKLCNRIMITPGNLGVREIAYGVISQQMQFGMAEGMLISLIMRCIGTIVICVLGLLMGGHSLFGRKSNYIEPERQIRGPE